MSRRRAAQWSNRDGMCASHKPQFLFCFDADVKIEKGEHQEQCATCKRWFWPEECGENFVSTGRPDTA